MIPKLVEVLGTVNMVIPQGSKQELQKVTFGDTEVFAMTWVHGGHSLYLSAKYLLNEADAKRYLELAEIYSDLSKEMSPEHHVELVAMGAMNHHEILERLN